MNQPAWKTWLPVLAAIAAFYIATLGYFSPVLEGKHLKQHDIMQYKGMAQEMVEHREAYDGDEPLWTGSMFGGMPAYQIGVVWPANAMNWVDSVLHGFLPRPASFLFLYMAGMFILLLCLRVDAWLALVGALAYAFSSYFLIIIEAGHNSKATAVGYMPMVLGGLYVLLRGRKFLGAALFALFLAMQVHANHLQVTYYLAMMLALFGLAELWRAIQGKQLADFAGRAALGVAGIAVALLCNLGLLWSTWEYGAHTTRGKSELTIDPQGNPDLANKTDGLDRDYVTHWSYGKQESLSLLVPDVKGGASGSLVQSQEDLAAIQDPAFRKAVLDIYQGGGYVNNYWGDQDFTSGPVYVGAIVLMLMLLMLAGAEGRAGWWMLSAVPLAIVLGGIGSPVLAGLLLIAYLLAGLFLWKDTLGYALFASLVLTLLLSWGHHLMPLTDFFLDHVPGYNKFRAVTIILVIVELAVPVLGVLYLQRITREGGWDAAVRKRFLITSGILAGVLLLLAVMPGSFLSFFSGKEMAELNGRMATDGAGTQRYIDGLKALRTGVVSADAWRSLLFILLGGGLLFAFGRKWIGKGLLYAGIGVLVLVDLWGVDRRYVNNEKDAKGQYLSWEDEAASEHPYKPQPVDMAILQAESNAATEADLEQGLARLKERKAKLGGTGRLVSKEDELEERFASLRRTSDFRVLALRNPFQSTRESYFHRSLGGYHGAKLKRYQELIEFHISPEIGRVIGAFGEGATMQRIDSVLAGQPVLNMLNTRYVIYADDQPPIRNSHALGSAWFVDEVREVKNADEEITGLGKIDPRRTALVDARFFKDVAGAAHSDNTASVKLNSYRSNELVYTVKSANGGVVVFSEIWYGPDWVAEIDGKPAPYVRADYVLRAMKVPAGEHTVRFHVVSKAYNVGGRLAAVSSFVLLALVLLALGLEWRASRQRTTGEQGNES